MSGPTDDPNAAGARGMTAAEAYRAYLDAIVGGRRREAFDVVERARGAGLDLRAFYLDVFQPALRELGRLWQENRLTVAEEHLATAITQSAMLRIFLGAGPPAGVGPLLIAACTESERHEIGLRMLCDFMELAGWETVFLGASVPTESLVAMVVERRPQAVALSASIGPHLPQVRGAIEAIRAAADPAPLILVGGRPFLEDPDLAARLGADVTATDAAEAAARLVERFP